MSTIIGLVSTFRLPLQETRQKSKKSKKEPQNGRQSNKNASRGPKR